MIIGESRSHIRELMDRDPLGKLSALMCPAETWTKYGMTHPAGRRCRGLVDLIYHDLDPQKLRALAPTIPFELVEEFTFMGNATEIADRVHSYADNGLQHVIVANGTGTVGGLDEINDNTTEFKTADSGTPRLLSTANVERTRTASFDARNDTSRVARVMRGAGIAGFRRRRRVKTTQPDPASQKVSPITSTADM
nr:hypothetical protein [Mycobacterium shigaense]MEA1121414.1 hypothetical protein [Mycobacterium shigaense]